MGAVDMGKKLPPRRQRFVDEYLKDLNAKQAAIRAGYTAKRAEQAGYELLTFPDVAAAIAAAKKDRAERTRIDQDYVLNLIVNTVERCAQHRPVLDASGKPVMVETESGEMATAYTFDPASVLRGADLLARHVGFYQKDNEQGAQALEVLLRSAKARKVKRE